MTGEKFTDYYTDLDVVQDPYPYFDRLRRAGNAVRLPAHNVVAVTDFEGALAVHLDNEHFSAVNAVTGPLPPLPFTAAANDITDEIERHRPDMPFGMDMLTMDPPRHTGLRSLMMKLFTPRRLKEMEPALDRLADSLIDEFAASGKCEIVGDYATSYAILAIAELLGVPEADREDFRRNSTGPASRVSDDKDDRPFVNPMDFREGKFTTYVEERRKQPLDDILSQLATAEYPDGTEPDMKDVVRIGTLLFGAGQDTTATLIGNSVLMLAENAEIQARLRDDFSLIPSFIEEVLRLYGPVKATHRLARKSTSIAGVDVPAGTHVMIASASANRDPQKFDEPDKFIIGRKRDKEHLSFGRGIHTCPGAALARTETRISLERILTRLSNITIDEDRHGPPSNRKIAYQPTYVFRSIKELHLRFEPERQT